MSSAPAHHSDIVLIGAGIMSATLGAFLRELDPGLTVTLFETLSGSGRESSDAWNNAGTGHAGYCELNYTPLQTDGSVDIAKAVDVNAAFELSRQLWAHWIRTGRIKEPGAFIQSCPHISLVRGQDDVAFLKERFKTLSAHHCFESMEYSEDPKVIAEWAPLTMQGHTTELPIAATRVQEGTDVNYGALTRLLVQSLENSENFSSYYNCKVTGLRRISGKRWQVTARSSETGRIVTVDTAFVFIGAGGGALPLLQKSGIPEARSYAGFPVSGLWLQCTAPDITRLHHAKVYGNAAVGAPPMSVPHLDTRLINGRPCLLFGPYAGFSTKFLKSGSWSDYFRTLTLHNILPALTAGWKNLSLVRYLIGEVLQTEHHRFQALLQFYPKARREDWQKVVAGQRVQIIKTDDGKHGTLKFGTELVTSTDRSLATVLGASPGASVTASIALEILKECFPNLTDTEKLTRILPTYDIDLRSDALACRRSRQETARTLGLSPD